MKLRLALASLVWLGVVAQSTTALAALTDSEKGQLRSFFEASDLSTVPRMRALAARPDLSANESAEALASAFREQPLTEARQRYLHALLFGPASQPSRAALISPVSRALLARADLMLRDRPGSIGGYIETEPAAFEELMAIHQFIGKSLGPESGMGATIRNESLRSVAQAYGQHVAQHAALMGHRNKAEGRGLLLRSQIALNLAALSNVLSNREEVASWLGLDPVSKGFFLRTGAVLEVVGDGPAIRAAEVARVVESVPNALRGVSLVLVDKVSSAPLKPSTAVLAVRSPVGALAPAREGWWGADRSGEAPEQALCEAAWVVSDKASREAFKANPKLDALAAGAVQRASGKGEATLLAPWLIGSSLDRDAQTSPTAILPRTLAVASAAMLLVDGRRTLDIALSRWLAGQGHAFEQLLVGLSVLADGSGGAVQLGQQAGKASLRVPVTLQEGVVAGFELDGHKWTIERSGGGAISRLRVDNREPGAWAVSSASVPLTAGDRWAAGTLQFVRLSGAPRVAVLDDGRIIIASAQPATGQGLDAIQAKAPAADHEVLATVRVESGKGGLVVRAVSGTSSFQGVALKLTCEPPGGSDSAPAGQSSDSCVASLVQIDDAGQEQAVASPASPIGAQPSGGFQVRLAIKGSDVRASVGTVEIQGKLSKALKPGHAGVMVERGGRLEVRDWRVQGAGHTGPKGPRK
ncbi:MAG: hypothetical protein HY898_21425 [Deltaproteobacteria bacterium]|nr:hypothetical protein [Deltaproteobacteria bacterium]